MKTLLIVLSTLSFCFSGITVGGYVPLVSTVSCVQENYQSDNSNTEVLLATCTISNNAEVFSARFKFGTNEISDLRIQGGEGTLGNGIEVPNENITMLDEYTWFPNRQNSATLNYTVRFYGKFNGKINNFIQYATMNSVY